MEFTYQVGGKTYVQTALVLGQVEMLAPILIKLTGSFTPDAIVEIGKADQQGEAESPAAYLDLANFLLQEKKLAEALAIILVEKGTELWDRDVKEVEDHLRKTIGIPVVGEIIKDFFTCNDWKSLAESLSVPSSLAPPASETRS